MSNSHFNASFSSRRNFVVDTLPSSDGTVSPSPTLLGPDTMVPVEAIEDVVSSFLSWLREGKGEWPRFQDQRDQLSLGIDGRRDRHYTTRDIQERDEKIEEQQACIEALEAEVALLKQAQVEMANDHEEQDMTTMEDLDNVYQMLLDMEQDVKESEVTRLERSAEYAEERERYVALEEALEADRQAIFQPWNALEGCEYVLVHCETEGCLRNDLSTVRADVDGLRAEMHEMKTSSQAAHALAEEMDVLQGRVRTMERELRWHRLLAAEVRTIEVAEIARLASDERTASINASVVDRPLICQSEKHAGALFGTHEDNGQRFTSLDAHVDDVMAQLHGASKEEWMSSGSEHSFCSSDFGGTSSPPPKHCLGSLPDTSMSFVSLAAIDAEDSESLGGLEGELFSANSTDCLYYSRISERSGRLYTNNCSAILDPLAHRVRRQAVTRTIGTVRDPSNEFLPPSFWELRAFEPP